MKKTSKTRPTKNTVAVKSTVDLEDDFTYDEENMNNSTPTKSRSRNLVTLLGILIIAGIAVYKFSYIAVPASVNGRPVYIWSYLNFMHRSYGMEAIQTLTTQELINQEISKQKVKVSNDQIQQEVDQLDKEASASGGLSAVLAAQQMTLEQLKDQLRIQIAVKAILKDKIAVSDEEVNDYYKQNKDFFKGTVEKDAKVQIRVQLESQKFQKEASAWLAEVKKDAKIEISFPGLK